MSKEVERYAALVGVVVLVGAIAFWKGVDAPVALIAMLGTVLAYLGVDHFLLGKEVQTAPAGPSTPQPPAGEFQPVKSSSAGGPTSRSATLDSALLNPDSVEQMMLSPKHSAWSLRIAKHGQSIEECEDAVRIDEKRFVLAVADGASSSFGAGLWAKILVDEFVASPPKPLSPPSLESWLDRCRSVAAAAQPEGQVGWWAEKGAEQGAFATVVGAAAHGKKGERLVTIMCLGDSCAFLLDGTRGSRKLRRSIPYEDSSQFGSHPSLIGSMSSMNALEPSWTSMNFEPGQLLVLASDAVAEWLLANPRRFSELDSLSIEELSNLLVTERSAGRIVNDDLTVAMLGLP